MADFKICASRKKILTSNENILVEGGPGSGKTTMALLKAKRVVESENIAKQQKVLFLSFARATITRIEEQAKNYLPNEIKKSIEINTYHGFCWSIVKTHGYLLYHHRKFKLVTPPNLAALVAEVPKQEQQNKKLSMLRQEGFLCFDLFAETTYEIFKRSDKILRLTANAYPFIIVDEFQDTDRFEWEIIKLLGKYSRIMALADLEQRIYDFRGASVTRIPEFVSHFKVEKIDLGKENNRSNGTDIAIFGDDLLTGANIGKKYTFVSVEKYPFYTGKMSRISLKNAIFRSIARLKRSNPKGDWSIAILVKTKSDTLSISTYLTSEGIAHEVIIDPAGPSLAALIISTLLEPLENSLEANVNKITGRIIAHIRGRKGDRPNQADLKLAKFLEDFLIHRKANSHKRKLLVSEIENLIKTRQQLNLTGIPEDDWLSVRRLFQESTSDCLKNIYEDARYLKLLRRGTLLSQKLSERWRNYGNYTGASISVDEALTQEHFSMSSRVFRGIFVMNIHKSKGKEFDEVVIWEEYKKPIVYNGDISEGRRLLRVAITRARSFSTFLTPKSEPCILV